MKKPNKSGNKILFICGNIGENSSQGVRYKGLLPVFSDQRAVTCLSFYRFINHPKIKSETLLQNSLPSTNFSINSISSQVKRTLNTVYKTIIRPFIFPDKYRFYICQYKEKIYELLKKENFKVVIVAVTPFSLLSLPKIIKEYDNKIKVIVDLSDPFYGNISNNYTLFHGKSYIEKFERKNLSYVDHLVVLNPKIKKEYVKRLASSQKISVIEQGIDLKKISALNVERESRNKNTLIYGGGLNHKLREPFNLYDAVKCFQGELKLHLYGNIDQSLLPISGEMIYYHGMIPHNELIMNYFDSDIIVFIDNAIGIQIPGKLLEILAIGKPVLFLYSNTKSPTLDYLSNSNQVFKVKNEPQDIVQGIKNIINSKSSFFPKTELSQYSWESLAIKYLNIIDD